jgi:uncharacterized protein (TIGR01370 family)
MVAWVRRIAGHARNLNPGALVIPQNGAQLLDDPAFQAAIDAIGIEDLFTNGNTNRNAKHTAHLLEFLGKTADKPVLLIEYGSKPEPRRHAIECAKRHGFVLLLADRQLKTLGESPPSTSD